jgi:UDP-N-acetylglucosamine--N-acetylmuramyl-(pentapeptide) pyrophosphoryl-undecaprenol N-acetylglucosamine transferase
LTRSGSGTISELLGVGVPMILVPYPSAADNHQHANAQWVAGNGAGVVVQQDALTPQRIAELVRTLLLSEKALKTASAAAAGLALPHAAARILDAILTQIGLSESAHISDSKKRAAA